MKAVVIERSRDATAFSYAQLSVSNHFCINVYLESKKISSFYPENKDLNKATASAFCILRKQKS